MNPLLTDPAEYNKLILRCRSETGDDKPLKGWNKLLFLERKFGSCPEWPARSVNMGLFGNKKKKGKGQDKDALIPIEQAITPPREPNRTKPNLR